MSNLVKLIIIGILIIAIPVSVKLVQEQQILKSRATEGTIYPCGAPDQIQVGTPQGSCQQDGQTCTAYSFYKYTDENGQAWCDNSNCAAPCSDGTTPPSSQPPASQPPGQVCKASFKPSELGINDPRVCDRLHKYVLIAPDGRGTTCQATNVTCQTNDQCPQNTSNENIIIPGSSNWCYGFSDRAPGCLQLQYIGQPGAPSCIEGGDGGSGTACINPIGRQSPDLGATCTACIASNRSGLTTAIKRNNPNLFTGCTDKELINYWCNGGMGAEAQSQCNSDKSGVCEEQCSVGSGGPATGSDPTGWLDSKTDGVTCSVRGWTCDADSYSTPLRVDFYANGPAGQGVGIGSVTAAASRESAVGTQCGGNNNHGFSFAVPANSLRDGQPHNIYAYGINTGGGTNTLLPGSPKSVTCTIAPITTAPSCNTPASGSTVNPQNVSFSWGAVTGATIYDFRLWDYSSGGWDDAHWQGEVIVVNALTGTSYNGTGGNVIGGKTLGSPINLTAGKNYRYRVSARTSLTGAPGPWADCNFTAASSPPRIEFRVAETPDFAGATWEAYTGAGMSRNYTFQDQRPGLKTVFVEFRDSQGNTQAGNAQIELVAPPSPSPSPSPTPSVPPVVTTQFRIAETPTDLTSAEWQLYTSVPMRIDNFEFKKKAAEVKTIFVQFKDSKGRVACDTNKPYCTTQIRLLGDDPVITSCSLGFEDNNTTLRIKGKNFGSAKGTVKSGDTALQVKGSWKDDSVEVILTSAGNGQTIPVSLTNLDGQIGEGTCGTISQLALGNAVFCRAPSSKDTDNVDLTLVGAYQGGTKVKQKVKIDKDGVIQGLTQKLEGDRQYALSIKAPRSLRKTVLFTAGDGTTNLASFILPVGDIFPADGGDGKTNALDKAELNRQWIISADATGRSGDFNRDGRVNSIDWACMRFDFGKEDDPEAAPGIQPSPSPSPSPSVAGQLSCSGVTVEGPVVDTSKRSSGETIYIVNSGARLKLTANATGTITYAQWIVPGQVTGYSDSVGKFEYPQDYIKSLTAYYIPNNITQKEQLYYLETSVGTASEGTGCGATWLKVLPKTAPSL